MARVLVTNLGLPSSLCTSQGLRQKSACGTPSCTRRSRCKLTANAASPAAFVASDVRYYLRGGFANTEEQRTAPRANSWPRQQNEATARQRAGVFCKNKRLLASALSVDVRTLARHGWSQLLPPRAATHSAACACCSHATAQTLRVLAGGWRRRAHTATLATERPLRGGRRDRRSARRLK